MSGMDRMPEAYRIGYWHGRSGQDRRTPSTDIPTDELCVSRAFASNDYDSGYKAGANDAKWSAVYAAKARA